MQSQKMTTPTPHLTRHVRMVLDQFFDDPTWTSYDPNRKLYGQQICEAIKLTGGTVYPILKRLRKAGWLASHRETPPFNSPGAPRRYHQLTERGADEARYLTDHAAARRGARREPRP